MRCLLLFCMVPQHIVAGLGCNRGSDCGDHECCMITPDGTVCQPMPKEGEACTVEIGIFPIVTPDTPVRSCPCDSNLVCYVEGLQDQGTCTDMLAS